MSKTAVENKSVYFRIVGIGGGLLGAFLIGLQLLESRLTGLSSQYGNQILVAIMLLLIWLFVTACVRSLHRLRKRNISTWALITCGTLVALLGTLVFFVWLGLSPGIEKNTRLLGGITLGGVGFGTSIGFVAALITAFRLRWKK